MVDPLVIEQITIGSHRLISVSVVNNAVMDTLIYTFLGIYPSIPSNKFPEVEFLNQGVYIALILTLC